MTILCAMLLVLVIASSYTADSWSFSRTYCLVAEAIIDREIDRGVHVTEALRFGLGIMRKSEVCE